MTSYIRKLHVAITLLSITSIGYSYGSVGESLNCCPCQPSCGTGFISADLLYWRAYQSGLDTCVPVGGCDGVSSGGFVTSTFRGKDRDPHFKWNPGFRIGAGYEFACSNWGFGSSWTHFNSSAHAGNGDCNSLRWNVKLDVVDLVAAYEYDLCSCFVLRPFAGLRGARIKQNSHSEEFAFPAFSDSDTSSFSSSSISVCNCFEGESIINDTRNRQKFVGIGPLLGLEADWDIGCGFSVYASASISWLYGKYHVKLEEFEQTFDASNCCIQRKNLDGSPAVGDATLGVRWETCVCDDTRFFMQFGLEHHRYFDFNRIGCYGDLSFDGVNLSAGFVY
jgi:hypothetical protein